jgi:hypothetical protein
MQAVGGGAFQFRFGLREPPEEGTVAKSPTNNECLTSDDCVDVFGEIDTLRRFTWVVMADVPRVAPSFTTSPVSERRQ